MYFEYRKIRSNLHLLIFIFLLLIAYSLFSVANFFENYCLLLAMFFLVPFIFEKLYLNIDYRRIFSNISFDLKSASLTIVIILSSFLILLGLSDYFDFFGNYSIPIEASSGIIGFFSYELFFVFVLSFLFQYFLTGFVLLNIKNLFNEYFSYLIFILVLMFMIVIGRNQMGMFYPYLIFSPILGLIGIKNNSFIYPALLQFFIIILFDISKIYF